MSHVTHVTCHKYQVTNYFTKDPVCHIFLESSCKIQLIDNDKKIACKGWYMLHVTFNKYKYPVCYIFLESLYKIHFNGHEQKIKY